MDLPSQKKRLVKWGFADRDIVLWRAKIKRSLPFSGAD
jgi:hypothetical protein